jgi:hypothetical protein
MSSNTFLVLLVILNLLAIHYAYRIDSNDEPTQALFHKYEESANDEERLANLNNLKSAEEYNSNNYYSIPCHPTSSSYILCKKLDYLSRRDTGFLRFGRRR